jgi:hypothetical protein
MKLDRHLNFDVGLLPFSHFVTAGDGLLTDPVGCSNSLVFMSSPIS